MGKPSVNAKKFQTTKVSSQRKKNEEEEVCFYSFTISRKIRRVIFFADGRILLKGRQTETHK